MMIKFLQRYEKWKFSRVIALKDGKRYYDVRFVYVVKDSTVELTKKEEIWFLKYF